MLKEVSTTFTFSTAKYRFRGYTRGYSPAKNLLRFDAVKLNYDRVASSFLLFFPSPSSARRSWIFRGAPSTCSAGLERVALHTPARAILACARVNYELRKIVSEDDLHTQRAARKGIGR